ncbi:uncharacterized protein [Argopecten irradians]|uniref:uncharacterized protein n=1 Tax=Argopecten irradians TaxID=31199 RepID=UPI00371511F4
MAESIRFDNKIFVKTKPWSSERRNSEFPLDDIHCDKMTVESTVFDLEITSPSSSKEECLDSDKRYQSSIGLDSRKEEDYYTMKNSAGQIEISCRPTVPTRLATYTFHVRHKGKEGWAQYTSRITDGEKAVSIDTDPFDIDAVFVTSQLDTHAIDVTTEGCTIYLDPENKDMKIVFPPNCVLSTMKVTIQVTTLYHSLKKEKITKLLGNEHGILGVSDLVNVTHYHPFLVPIRLTLPIPPLQPTPKGEQPTLLALHVDDDDIHEIETAHIKGIGENLYEVTTDRFSSVVCVRCRSNRRRRSSNISAVKYIYELDDPRCNILLFLKREPEGKLRLRSEIVSQDERKEKETERANTMEMDLLSACTSPTIQLKNLDRVRVSLANNTAVVFHTTPATQFIRYDRHNQDNSISYFVRVNTDFGTGSYATLEYDLDSGNRRLLHKADFHVHKEIKKPKQPCHSAVFSEKSMMRLARKIPVGDYTDLAVLLEIPSADADRLALNRAETDKMFSLLHWLQKASGNPQERLDTLTEALTEIGQTVIADGIKDASNKKESFKS